MQPGWPINVLVEGIVDEVVILRLCQYLNWPVERVYDKRGKGYIISRLSQYNAAAKFAPWLVVVDLDQDAGCAPEFIQDTLPQPAQGMCFRVAVRAIEAWLLADSEHFATYLQVPRTKFPDRPDEELNPKITIVNLVRQHCRRKAIQQDIVPSEGTGSSVGPGYEARLIEFVRKPATGWRPDVALHHSDSLWRCVEALETLKDWKPVEDAC
jgi:hypothetical protein